MDTKQDIEDALDGCLKRIKRLKLGDGNGQTSAHDDNALASRRKGLDVSDAFGRFVLGEELEESHNVWENLMPDIIQSLSGSLKQMGLWAHVAPSLRLVNKYWLREITHNISVISPHVCRDMKAHELLIRIQPWGLYKGVRYLDLMGCEHQGGNWRGMFRNLRNLRGLAISGSDVTDKVAMHIASQTSLEHLVIKENIITNEGIESLSVLKRLERLEMHVNPDVVLGSFRGLNLISLQVTKPLKGMTIDETCMLARVTTLENLSLVAVSVDVHGLLDLAALTRLTRLEVQCGQVQDLDKGVEVLSKALTRLEILEMEDCETLTNVGMMSIASLSGLGGISLTNCPFIMDNGIRGLSTLLGLRGIKLSKNDLVTLDPFGALPNLEILHLCELQGIHDVQLTTLASLGHITSLKLRDMVSIGGGDEFVQIGMLRNLRELDLCGCSQVECHMIYSMSWLTNLTSLSLGKGIQDQGLKNLHMLPWLQKLCLVESRIYGEGITALAFMPCLCHLRFWRCHEMSEQTLLPIWSNGMVLRLETLDLCPIKDFKWLVDFLKRVYPSIKIQETETFEF